MTIAVENSFTREAINGLRIHAKANRLVFAPLARLKNSGERRQQIVSRDTDIVIEGFPRSANSFSVTAFRKAQRSPVKIAHHFHAPAQILLAIEWGVPTLTLVRHPVDAVTSLLIFEPRTSLHAGIKEYVLFYRTLLPHLDSFVIGVFDDVVNDLGRVIERVNQKFGTAFDLFQHTEGQVKELQDWMDRNAEALGNTVPSMSKPVPARDRRKDEIKEELKKLDVQLLFSEAMDLYKIFHDKGKL